MVREGRSPAGDLTTSLILEIFRSYGLLITAGDRLAAPENLTAARWQVLGSIALSDRPIAVPEIARAMGLSRQSVQVSVNRLLEGELITSLPNEAHRRSPLFALTDSGRSTYEALSSAQASWVNGISEGMSPDDLATAISVLRRLIQHLS